MWPSPGRTYSTCSLSPQVYASSGKLSAYENVAGTDWTSNIVRVLCEERLNFAVERPAAMVYVSGLPTAAPTEATATKTTAKK
jgi:hypothetical protein